ncbi:MAG: DUF1064 domain-containing protein [Thermoanaerobaculia bacterium]
MVTRGARGSGFAVQLQPPRHKYGAQATVVDGRRFHSAREARRYQELRLLERAGEITALRCQVPFPLLASGAAASTPVGVYVADFTYRASGDDDGDGRGRDVVEDVKGCRTALYNWKRRHFALQYGRTITEV